MLLHDPWEMDRIKMYWKQYIFGVTQEMDAENVVSNQFMSHQKIFIAQEGENSE